MAIWRRGAQKASKRALEATNVVFAWPGLHNEITRMAPMVPQPAPYAANYTFNWLAAAGSACALATMAAAVVLRVSVGMYVGILGRVLKQLEDQGLITAHGKTVVVFGTR